MWTRALLKENAKQALAGRYWRCFAVSLALWVLGGGLVQVVSRFREITSLGSYDDDSYWTEELESVPMSVAALLGFAVVLGIFIGACWRIFVTQPLEAGSARYYMESRQSLTPFDTVTSIFRKPYGNVVGVQFLVQLKIGLGCLVIVPGIYWSFCYALVPYLLAENPYMSAGRAMELSKEMMYGEKWNYFVLRLSFLGWQLLAALTVIGDVFLTPYIEATYAEFYAAMRAKAFAQGMTTADELGGFVRHDA